MSRATAIVTVAVVAGACVVGAAAGAPGGASGSWVGTYTLGGSGEISVSFSGARATAALGAGHAGVQVVPVSAAGGGIRFQLPGRPAALVFNARLRGATLIGAVSQGAARGTFRATRGRAPALVARGTYAGGGKTAAVVDDPYGPERLVDLGSGEVHALFVDGAEFRIGSGFATRAPSAGVARFDPAGARLPSGALRRVRVRSIRGSLLELGSVARRDAHAPPWLRPASGCRLGPRLRIDDACLPARPAALLLGHGVAVLAYDKRGMGQSGGRYPGESPTRAAIDVLARDAAAAARFLATQPEIDRGRIGVAGHSQAGWIMPLAATREPRIRFLVAFAGPVVTADENDLYQTLAGQGETPQQLSDDEVDAQVLAQGPSGVDPMPWIRRLTVPHVVLRWARQAHPDAALGRTARSARAGIGPRPHRVGLPRANHALVETATGLTSEMLRSDRFARGLFALVSDWLRKHGLT